MRVVRLSHAGFNGHGSVVPESVIIMMVDSSVFLNNCSLTLYLKEDISFLSYLCGIIFYTSLYFI
jgi:hypothetical protein